MPTDAELRLEGAYLVVEWMRVRTESGYATDGYSLDMLKCDLDHSSLIRWLCSGRAALPEPPPVCMSRPDHQAAVDGKFEPFNVHESPCSPETLIIENEPWKILVTKGPNDWVAVYRLDTAGSRWSTPWSIRRAEVENSQPRFGNGPWIAERLPSASPDHA